MRRASLPVSLAALGLVLLALGLRAPSAQAAEVLMNGGFESGLNGWTHPGSWTSVPSPSGSGLAARIDATTASATLYQSASAFPGASYAATVWVQSGGDAGSATLTVKFVDESFVDLPGSPTASKALVDDTFVGFAAAGTAPAGTASVRFVVTINRASTGTMTAYVDSASLVETLPPPTNTPTPTSTPTATFTPLSDTPTPVASPTSSPTPDGTFVPPAGTPTRTPTSTKTPTPDASPTSKSTPTSTRSPTATSAPTSSGPTATPALPPGTEPFGGLIRNGNFEWLDGPRAAWWAKFGGDLSLTHDAYRGSWAGILASETTSTKWLHQVAPVDAGDWYAATGVARVASGEGEAFLRLSWYEAPDGSGSAIAQHDSPMATGAGWEHLDTGPVQAPTLAASVRVRLMLRPAGPDPVQAAFDDVALAASAPASAPAPAPPTPRPAVTAVAGARTSPRDASPDNNEPSGRDTPLLVVPVVGPDGLRLSEVLSDPEEAGRDSAFEWVEIVNAGDQPVDTAGWKIGDGKEIDTLPSAVLQPGEFAVIAGRSAKLPPGVRVVRVADGEIGGGLNNSGDVLRLVSPAGEEVDAISFGDNKSVFDPPPSAPGPGRTLGVHVVGAEPSGDTWALTERPTPGEPNVFPAPKPGPRPAAAAVSSNLQPLVEPARDSARDNSAVPWIILGVALGAGAFGGLEMARRASQQLKQRFRRGR